MKTAFALIGAAILTEWLGFRAAHAILAQAPPATAGEQLLRWWPVLAALAGLVMAWKGTQMSVAFIKAQLDLRVTQEEFRGKVANIDTTIEGLERTLTVHFSAITDSFQALDKRLDRIERVNDERKRA